jgi:hypothetical protein
VTSFKRDGRFRYSVLKGAARRDKLNKAVVERYRRVGLAA